MCGVIQICKQVKLINERITAKSDDCQVIGVNRYRFRIMTWSDKYCRTRAGRINGILNWCVSGGTCP